MVELNKSITFAAVKPIKSYKMSKKVILFARVSTVQQDLQRQKELLLPLIKEDGYKDDEITIIDYKESAIKNDLQHRKSISEMETLIATEPIEAVYVTEISRLGRRNDVLYAVFGLLEEHHIALVVQSPQLIRTINKDGSANPMGQLVILFMRHLAVSEMDIKKERSKSGMDTRKKQGHLVVSRVKFGYYRTKDNRAEIDDEAASIVRKCFQMYLEGDSCGVIYDKMHNLANWEYARVNSRVSKVQKLLRDPTYIGKNKHLTYPPIIDEETFNKVQEKLSENYSAKYRTKYVYYCHKLIHWNGYTFSPAFNGGCYRLTTEEGKDNCLNIDCFDGVTKQLAIEAYTVLAEESEDKKKESFLKSKEEAEKKIKGIDKEIATIQKQLDRLNDLYVDGKVEKDVYDFRYEKAKGEMDYLIKEKEANIVTISTANDILSNKKNNMWATMAYMDLDELADEKQIADIINQTIKSIDLEKIDNGWIVRYTYKDAGYNERMKEHYYKYLKKNNKVINFYECIECDDSEFYADWSGQWEKRLVEFKKAQKKGGSK